MALDPIGGQGANNGNKMVRNLVESRPAATMVKARARLPGAVVGRSITTADILPRSSDIANLPCVFGHSADTRILHMAFRCAKSLKYLVGAQGLRTLDPLIKSQRLRRHGGIIGQLASAAEHRRRGKRTLIRAGAREPDQLSS